MMLAVIATLTMTWYRLRFCSLSLNRCLLQRRNMLILLRIPQLALIACMQARRLQRTTDKDCRCRGSPRGMAAYDAAMRGSSKRPLSQNKSGQLQIQDTQTQLHTTPTGTDDDEVVLMKPAGEMSLMKPAVGNFGTRQLTQPQQQYRSLPSRGVDMSMQGSDRMYHSLHNRWTHVEQL